jgi:hypothetical protein
MSNSKWRFSPQEDALLVKAVNEQGSSNWSVVAAQVPRRTPRQCRERWRNYANPALTHGPWTREEDNLLLAKFAEHGSNWSLITEFLKGRGKNDVRNRYLSVLQRSGNPPNPSTRKSAPPGIANSPDSQESFLEPISDNSLFDWHPELDQFPSNPFE